MKDLKIYVVSNIDKFKELCEKKLGKNITPENFIAMENFRNDRVHLVPRNIPYELLKYYIPNTVLRYEIYVENQGKWILTDITSIDEKDIDELLENNAIEDLEESKNWKDIFAYEVIDIKDFLKQVDGKITDKEMITLLSIQDNYNLDIYLINTDNEFSILYKNHKTNTLRELPYTKFDEQEILDLIKNDVISSSRCQIKNDFDSIKLENEKFEILSSRGINNIFIRIRPDGKYDIRTRIRNGDFYRPSMVRAIGDTEAQALKSLKTKLFDRLNSPSITFKVYQHLLQEKDFDI